MSEVCYHIVLNCLYLARIGRPDILWSVNKLARSVTKWTQACDRRLARLISHIHFTSGYRQYCHVGNAAQHCRLGLFQGSDFAEDLEDSKSASGGVLCIFGRRTILPISWMCKKQTSVSHSSTVSEIISLDAGLRMDGLLALDLWDLVIEVLRTTQRIPKPTQACTQEKGVKTQITPKIEQVLDQNVDLSNIDQVLSNAHLSEKESKLYIFEDNEAVIKMIIKDRSPTMRHVSRTHRVALDWLFDRINLDPNVQIMYVESQNQLAVILTKGSFTRDEWHNLLHLFNIMNDTKFSCSHFYSHYFPSAGKPSEMSRRSQESSSLGSPTAKARACCLVSRESISVGQNYSSNPKRPGSRKDSQVWSWEERNELFSILDGTLFSMPRETESTCEMSFRTSKINSDTMNASWKYRSTLRR